MAPLEKSPRHAPSSDLCCRGSCEFDKSEQLITDVSQCIRSALEDLSEHYSARPGRSSANPPASIRYAVSKFLGKS